MKPEQTSTETRTVTRVRIYPRGGNYRMAWRFLYSCANPDGSDWLVGFDSLGTIEARIRRAGFRPVREWGAR